MSILSHCLMVLDATMINITSVALLDPVMVSTIYSMCEVAMRCMVKMSFLATFAAHPIPFASRVGVVKMATAVNLQRAPKYIPVLKYFILPPS